MSSSGDDQLFSFGDEYNLANVPTDDADVALADVLADTQQVLTEQSVPVLAAAPGQHITLGEPQRALAEQPVPVLAAAPGQQTTLEEPNCARGPLAVQPSVAGFVAAPGNEYVYDYLAEAESYYPAEGVVATPMSGAWMSAASASSASTSSLAPDAAGGVVATPMAGAWMSAASASSASTSSLAAASVADDVAAVEAAVEVIHDKIGSLRRAGMADRCALLIAGLAARLPSVSGSGSSAVSSVPVSPSPLPLVRPASAGSFRGRRGSCSSRCSSTGTPHVPPLNDAQFTAHMVRHVVAGGKFTLWAAELAASIGRPTNTVTRRFYAIKKKVIAGGGDDSFDAALFERYYAYRQEGELESDAELEEAMRSFSAQHSS